MGEVTSPLGHVLLVVVVCWLVCYGFNLIVGFCVLDLVSIGFGYVIRGVVACVSYGIWVVSWGRCWLSFGLI